MGNVRVYISKGVKIAKNQRKGTKLNSWNRAYVEKVHSLLTMKI